VEDGFFSRTFLQSKVPPAAPAAIAKPDASRWITCKVVKFSASITAINTHLQTFDHLRKFQSAFKIVIGSAQDSEQKGFAAILSESQCKLRSLTWKKGNKTTRTVGGRSKALSKTASLTILPLLVFLTDHDNTARKKAFPILVKCRKKKNLFSRK
jgi:hypothetical protein